MTVQRIDLKAVCCIAILQQNMTLTEHGNEKVLENNMLACWLNGQAIQTLSLTERAFNYGDGLFSTIAIRQGQASLIDLHWQRLVLNNSFDSLLLMLRSIIRSK